MVKNAENRDQAGSAPAAAAAGEPPSARSPDPRRSCRLAAREDSAHCLAAELPVSGCPALNAQAAAQATAGDASDTAAAAAAEVAGGKDALVVEPNGAAAAGEPPSARSPDPRRSGRLAAREDSASSLTHCLAAELPVSGGPALNAQAAAGDASDTAAAAAAEVAGGNDALVVEPNGPTVTPTVKRRKKEVDAKERENVSVVGDVPAPRRRGVAANRPDQRSKGARGVAMSRGARAVKEAAVDAFQSKLPIIRTGQSSTPEPNAGGAAAKT